MGDANLFLNPRRRGGCKILPNHCNAILSRRIATCSQVTATVYADLSGQETTVTYAYDEHGNPCHADPAGAGAAIRIQNGWIIPMTVILRP